MGDRTAARWEDRLERVRLVATDMDGTLLGPGALVGPRTASAVAAARAGGIPVVPVTGRPPHALWDLAARAGLGPVGVCSNGAAVVDLDSREVLGVDHLPGEMAAALVERARQAVPGVRFAVDNLDAFHHESDFFDGPVGWDEQIWPTDDLTPVLLSGCVKLIARTPGVSALELIRRLGPVLGQAAHATTSGLDWVDIGVIGVTKATGLARICERLAVAPEEVVAVGDNLNDLPMLSWAGLGLAVANATPEVLDAADAVLPANAADGVAQLLERLAGARTGSPG